MQAAAAYQSSLVGTTLFKSEWVTNQVLKAARAGTSEFLLRPGKNGCSGQKSSPNPPPPEMKGKGSKKEELQSLLSLEVGRKVTVWWDGVGHQGEIRELIPALDAADVRARVWYPGEGVSLMEHLAHMTWT